MPGAGRPDPRRSRAADSGVSPPRRRALSPATRGRRRPGVKRPDATRDHQHRAARPVDHGAGDTAEQHPLERAVATRAEHQQVELGGAFDQRGDRLATGDLRSHGQLLADRSSGTLQALLHARTHLLEVVRLEVPCERQRQCALGQMRGPHDPQAAPDAERQLAGHGEGVVGLGRVVEADPDPLDADGLLRRQPCRGHEHIAGSRLEHGLRDRSQQHPPHRAAVRGASDDQLRALRFGDRVQRPRGRRRGHPAKLVVLAVGELLGSGRGNSLAFLLVGRLRGARRPQRLPWSVGVHDDQARRERLCGGAGERERVARVIRPVEADNDWLWHLRPSSDLQACFDSREGTRELEIPRPCWPRSAIRAWPQEGRQGQ